MARHHHHPRQNTPFRGARNQRHDYGRGGGQFNQSQIDPTAGQSDYMRAMGNERNFDEPYDSYGQEASAGRDWDEGRFSGGRGQDYPRHMENGRQHERDFSGQYLQDSRGSSRASFNRPDEYQRTGSQFDDNDRYGVGAFGASDSYEAYQRAQPWRGDSWSRGQEHAAGGSAQQRAQMPKGYTRSDDRIKDDVIERLYHSGGLDLSDVSVEVKNGTVTLTGSVSHRSLKHRIEDICESCIAVTDVENRIRVKAQDGENPDEGQPRRGGSEKAGSSGGSKESRH